MNNTDLNKLKDLAIKAAAGSFPVPVAYEQPRIYSDAEISYLAFAAAVTPAAFLTIVNDLQAEVAAKQQNVDYLADRLPEAQHNGMMQLSHQLEEAQALLRHTQDKLGKALVRNSEYAGELARRDSAAAVPDGWKLVPVEPSEEMMMNKSGCQRHQWNDMSCSARQTRRLIWQYMVEAAPAPGAADA